MQAIAKRFLRSVALQFEFHEFETRSSVFCDETAFVGSGFQDIGKVLVPCRRVPGSRDRCSGHSVVKAARAQEFQLIAIEVHLDLGAAREL